MKPQETPQRQTLDRPPVLPRRSARSGGSGPSLPPAGPGRRRDPHVHVRLPGAARGYRGRLRPRPPSPSKQTDLFVNLPGTRRGTNRSDSHPTRMSGAGRPPAPGLFRGGPAPSTTGRHGTTRAQHRQNAFRTAGLLHHPPHLSKPPSRPRPTPFGLCTPPQRPPVQLQFQLRHPVHPFSPPFCSPPSLRRGLDKYRPRVKKVSPPARTNRGTSLDWPTASGTPGRFPL